MELAAEALSLLERLVRAQTDGENAVQAVIVKALKGAGCQVETRTYTPSNVPVIAEFAFIGPEADTPRTAVIGRLAGTDPTRNSLLLFAHPDAEQTHTGPDWERALFEITEARGCLHGWGVADDLAGCAAAVIAVQRLARTNEARGDLVFASTPSKRHARGVAALLHEGLAADAALYLHPAESGRGMREIKAVSPGLLEFTVTVTGRHPETSEPSHTAFSHLAVNPFDKAVRIHRGLMDLADRRAARVRHPLIEEAVGRATNLQISAVGCGNMESLSRLGGECVLGCSASFSPGETLKEVSNEIETAISEICEKDEWLREHPPRVDWVSGVSAAEVTQTDPLWVTASRAVHAVTGSQPILNPMHTASDIRVPLVEKGIPCVGLGCLAGDLTHSGGHDEWVDRDDYVRMVEVTARVASDWCASARSDA